MARLNLLNLNFGARTHEGAPARNISPELQLRRSVLAPRVRHKPRLLSDNGPGYSAGELAEWIGAQGMSHARGAPFHPQTQGKIERWHQTLQNRVLLENYFLPGNLQRQIEAFIEHYNHRRTLHSPGHG
jgi:putative transposase